MSVQKKTVIMIISWVLLIAWAGVIFMLSSEGTDASSGRSGAIVQTFQAWGATGDTDLLTFLVRKSAHITAYFIFGILAFNVLRLYTWPLRKTMLISMGLVLLYAISDEFHQYFVPGRSAEVCDVLIDTIAGVVGVLLAALIYSRIKAKHLKNSAK